MGELEQIAERYARRAGRPPASPGEAAFARCAIAEREAIYRRLLDELSSGDLARLSLLEVGCGGGGELARMIRLGLRPERLVGNELLGTRAAAARAALPPEVRIMEGDASRIELPEASFDVVFQSTVFTSVLDDALQVALAARMWRLVRPGGAILWYDFTVDNPRNPDVRGVPQRRVAELFPHAPVRAWRVTLAPPIGRRVARLGGWAYRALAAFPFLRTHLVAWIVKPTASPSDA